MVGLAGEDLVAPEELLEQHHPRELVRQRHPPERELRVVARQIGPERSAEHEHDIEARLTPFLQKRGERLRGQLATARVEQHDVGPLGDPALERLVLADLDDLHARLAAQQLLIVVDVVDEGRAQPPDRKHDEPH